MGTNVHTGIDRSEPRQKRRELERVSAAVDAAGEDGISRRRFLRLAGLGLGTVAVGGAAALGYRAYDQGVLEVGRGGAYAAWDRWQDGEGVLPLLRAATLAPSPHNAQAWLFEVGRRHVDLHVDRSRNTGAIDPFHREMYVGLGAALENLLVAARANGFAPTVSLMPVGDDAAHAARVELTSAAPVRSPLYDQIPRRHTNRYPYVVGRDVPMQALSAMSRVATAGVPEARLLWFTKDGDRAHIGELLVAATEEIVGDADQSSSDFEWFRQDWDELQRRRDGITLDAAGLPDLTATLGKLLPPQSPKATGESWLKSTRERHTKTAAAYGVVAVRDVRANRERLQGGRVLERAHLWATGHGLALHHMNQLTERGDRELQLGLPPRFGSAVADLMPSGWEALATFRIGYPTHAARKSPRRAVEAVMLA